jgi:hypothetical protein
VMVVSAGLPLAGPTREIIGVGLKHHGRCDLGDQVPSFWFHLVHDHSCSSSAHIIAHLAEHFISSVFRNFIIMCYD